MQKVLDTGDHFFVLYVIIAEVTEDDLTVRKLSPSRQANPVASQDPAHWGPAARRNARRTRRCSLKALHEAGSLQLEHLAAAAEIERVFLALTAGLFARPRREAIRGGRPRDMTEAAAIAYGDRFRPWASTLSERHKAGGPPILEVVIDCAVDGLSLREIDAARRWRHGRAAAYVVEGLELYATMAGWRTLPQAA